MRNITLTKTWDFINKQLGKTRDKKNCVESLLTNNVQIIGPEEIAENSANILLTEKTGRLDWYHCKIF